MSSKNLVFKILTLFNSFAFFIKRIWGFAHKTIFCQKVFCFLSFFNWFIRFINETFCSDKAIFLGNYKPCTHPHSPTPTNTDPYPANKKSRPTHTHPTQQKKVTPTHTHQHPAKKGHIHPHPATPSIKNITFTHTQPKNGRTYPNPPIPSQKRSHFPTPTHNQIKKVTASQKKVMPTHA